MKFNTAIAGPGLFALAMLAGAPALEAGFDSKVDYGVGIFPVVVVAGDFNGDGKRDLATANSITNNVSILLGNGDGTFPAAVDYPAGAAPWFVTVGDWNGDGKPDLAVANSQSNNVSILTGVGNGTFVAAGTYAVTYAPPPWSWPTSTATGSRTWPPRTRATTP
jgi:hypothetical protein